MIYYNLILSINILSNDNYQEFEYLIPESELTEEEDFCIENNQIIIARTYEEI